MRLTVWLRGALGLMALGMVLFTGACSLNPDTALRQESNIKEPAMQFEPKTVSAPALPPIDMAAPAEVETATFGLG